MRALGCRCDERYGEETESAGEQMCSHEEGLNWQPGPILTRKRFRCDAGRAAATPNRDELPTRTVARHCIVAHASAIGHEAHLCRGLSGCAQRDIAGIITAKNVNTRDDLGQVVRLLTILDGTSALSVLFAGMC